jgi:hypothetical protein
MKLTTKYGVVEGTPEELAAFVKRLFEGAAPPQPNLADLLGPPPEVVTVPMPIAPAPRAPQPSLPDGVYAYATPFPREKP